jgi:hypothetical protein
MKSIDTSLSKWKMFTKRQGRKSKGFGKGILFPILVMLLISCKSLEPMILLPPEVNFPSVPLIEGIEYSADGQTVYVPAEVWIDIAEYMIDVNTTEELYRMFREEYELSR